MKQNLILWIAAAVITFLAGFAHSLMNEYYPVSGSFGIDGKEIGYKLDKAYYGNDDYKFIVTTEIDSLHGIVKWKRIGAGDWNSLPLINSSGVIKGRIPLQKPLTRIEYLIKLNYNDKVYSVLPDNRPVELTFFGKVPGSVNFYYMFTLLGGLMLAFRTGLEYFRFPGKLKTLEIFTFIFFIVNVFAFHPLKLSYELGMVGKGAIPISAMFPFSSVLLFLIWTAATALIFNTKNYKIWPIPAAILTLIVYELGNF
ncbi:MAG TPA: hypothetical protein VLB50_13440 [Ignavibacteriaceae bacterium]|nr:hypothetical protein [Ignavibacteriaceae bacterium]